MVSNTVNGKTAAYLGSILLDRGDRIAFLGDAYVAQATALAAFSKDSHTLLAQSLNYTKNIGNDIEPYWIMWVLSVLDLFEATGDTTTFELLMPYIEKRLGRARDVLYPQAAHSNASLRWSRLQP
jgi:hypothetical protein